MKKMNFFKSLEKQVTEIPISDIMVKDVKTIHEEDTVQKLIDMMADYSIAGLLVVNEHEQTTGIVTEGDIIKKVLHKKKEPKSLKVGEIMTHHLFTIKSTIDIGNTIDLMKKHNISKLPVVDKEGLIGYVTKSDLLEKMNELYYQNTRLKWFPILVMIQLIFIAILILLLIKDNLPFI